MTEDHVVMKHMISKSRQTLHSGTITISPVAEDHSGAWRNVTGSKERQLRSTRSLLVLASFWHG
jgi:hypothetical protein